MQHRSSTEDHPLNDCLLIELVPHPPVKEIKGLHHHGVKCIRLVTEIESSILCVAVINYTLSHHQHRVYSNVTFSTSLGPLLFSFLKQ